MNTIHAWHVSLIACVFSVSGNTAIRKLGQLFCQKMHAALNPRAVIGFCYLFKPHPWSISTQKIPENAGPIKLQGGIRWRKRKARFIFCEVRWDEEI